MTQREMSLTQLTATRASGAVVLIRVYVGLIFVGAGRHSLDARMNWLDARMNRLDAPMNRSETATLVTSAAI
jgi:hypothetical protein